MQVHSIQESRSFLRKTPHQQQMIFGLKTTNFKDEEMYMAGLLGTWD